MAPSAQQIPSRPLHDLPLAEEVERKMKAWVARTTEGTPVSDVIPPFAARFNRKVRTKDLLTIASQEVDARVRQMEEEEASKVGDISQQLPWDERRDSIVPYWFGRTFSADKRALQTAYSNVLRKFAFSSRPLSIENAVARAPNLSLIHI